MWEKFKEIIKSMFSDIDGDISSKRFITFLFVIATLTTWACNLFWGMEISQFIYEGLLYIVGVGLGVITAEKFSPRLNDSQ